MLNSKEKIFTIDLTKNESKNEWEADLIINKIPFQNRDLKEKGLPDKEYEWEMNQMAKKITQGIEKKHGTTIH